MLDHDMVYEDYYCRIEVVAGILLITQNLVDELSSIFGGMGRLTSMQQSIWFGGEPNYDLDPGIVNRNYTTVG